MSVKRDKIWQIWDLVLKQERDAHTREMDSVICMSRGERGTARKLKTQAEQILKCAMDVRKILENDEPKPT